MSTSFGSTVMPDRTSCKPLTITRSPGFRPSSIARCPSCSPPSRTGRETTWLFLLRRRGSSVPGRCPRRGRDQQGLVGVADGHADAGEKAGESARPCWETRPDPQGAGFRIDLVVDEIDRALVGKPVLVGQAQRHGPPRVCGPTCPCLADRLPTRSTVRSSTSK